MVGCCCLDSTTIIIVVVVVGYRLTFTQRVAVVVKAKMASGSCGAEKASARREMRASVVNTQMRADLLFHKGST